MTPASGRLRTPAYRPDIDGLRALAVIAVILFHSRMPGFGGGYVGVDVFFVISGYLITQLLEVSREESTRRALGAFYLRRMRRILPALLATCLVTAIVAVTLFSPDELINVGKYLAATPVLLSNVATWTERSGYFEPDIQQLPLTHLWSISVEEQFYLIYPILLIAITRYQLPYRRLTLLVLAAASLALCVWASHYEPAANYFFAPTRAWELLLGATLAIGGTPRIGHRIATEGLAVASLLGIAIVVHLYSDDTPYPGTAAMLPCVATAALLATGSSPRPALVNRMLSWPPLVFVGLISYSLYLWHQPLLVFANYYRVAPLTPAATAVPLIATLLVAAASWRLIERPVRARVLMKSTRSLLVGAGVGSAGILLAGLVLWNSDGFPHRFPPEARGLFVSTYATPDIVRCEEVPLEQVRAGRVCNYGPGDGSPKVLVWGDSHALALMPAFNTQARAHGMHTYLVAKYNCLPLFAPPKPTRIDAATDRYACATFNAAVVEAIARLEPKLIILVGAWAAAEPPPHVPDIAAGIEQTVSRVSDHSRSVCVVFAVPKLKYAVSHALLVAHRRNIPDDFLTLSRADALAQHRDMEPAVRAIAQRSGLMVADPKDALCPADSCLYKADDRSLYFDDSHLSLYGALYVARTLEPCFAVDRR